MSHVKMEMCIDVREGEPPSSTTFNGKPIQSVSGYKYLGIVLDHKLKWDLWTDRLHMKSQRRMFLLKKLSSFNVDGRMIQMFYFAFIESILPFGVICWFGKPWRHRKNCQRNHNYV